MTTPLHDFHKGLGAKFTNFAGWEMPVEYSSIIEEVKAVRNSCGLFDLSHMGRLKVSGDLAKLEFLTSRNVGSLKTGKVQYNLLMNEEGGIKDDITIYRLKEDEFFLCVNAVNKDKVINWLSSHGLNVEDLSQKTFQFALQGRDAVRLLSKHFPVEDIKYYCFMTIENVIVSRTGYTGEDGFEVYAPLEEGMELFKKLARECTPCGLGARDTLRIEAGMPLYGHEIDESITPFEANLGRYVSLEKSFIGKDRLLERKVERELFGLELLGKGVPREGYVVFYNGREIGRVSSGTYSPTFQKGIAMCFVETSCKVESLEVELEVRNKRLPARLRSLPFLKKTRV